MSCSVRIAFLNMRVNNHLIEDGEVYVVFSRLPPEPDVGLMTPDYIIHRLESRKGRNLSRILKKMSCSDYKSIKEQLYEAET